MKLEERKELLRDFITAIKKTGIDILTDNDNHPTSILFLAKKTGKDTINVVGFPLFFDSTEEKNDLYNNLREMMTTKKPDAAVLLTEVWYVQRKDFADMQNHPAPSECDDRQEAIMTIGHADGVTIHSTASIKRDKNGTITLGKENYNEIDKNTVPHSGFTPISDHLFDGIFDPPYTYNIAGGLH